MKPRIIKDALQGLPCSLPCKGLIKKSQHEWDGRPIVGVSITNDEIIVRLGEKENAPLTTAELAQQLNTRSRLLEVKAKYPHDTNAFLRVTGFQASYYDDGSLNGFSLVMEYTWQIH